MKKALFATTALVLSAGVAAADITFNGNARFGLQHNSAPAAGATKTSLEKRLRFQVNATQEADNGVTFGGFLRMQSDENAGNRGFAGARVFARAGGLTVAVGNILGAIESMPGLYTTAGMSMTGLGWNGLVTNTVAKGAFGWDAFSSVGNGAEGIEAIYTMGDFTVHASYSSDSLRGVVGPSKNMAIYGAYNFSGWTVALGVNDSNVDTNDKVVLTVGGRIGDYSVGFQAADNDGVKKYVLLGGGTFGAVGVQGYIAKEDNQKTGYGIGAGYNLGGGARLVGGVERTPARTNRADLGVTFSF